MTIVAVSGAKKSMPESWNFFWPISTMGSEMMRSVEGVVMVKGAPETSHPKRTAFSKLARKISSGEASGSSSELLEPPLVGSSGSCGGTTEDDAGDKRRGEDTGDGGIPAELSFSDLGDARLTAALELLVRERGEDGVVLGEARADDEAAVASKVEFPGAACARCCW